MSGGRWPETCQEYYCKNLTPPCITLSPPGALLLWLKHKWIACDTSSKHGPFSSSLQTSKVMLLSLLTHVDKKSLLTADKLLILSREKKKNKYRLRKLSCWCEWWHEGDVSVEKGGDEFENQSERQRVGFVRMRFTVSFVSEVICNNSKVI